MAWAHVQTVTGEGFDTSITATLSSATAGNLLVAIIFTRASSISANPSGFTTMLTVTNATENDLLRVAWKIAVGGETALTWTQGNDQGSTAISEWSGNHASSPAGQSASTGRTDQRYLSLL